MTIMIDFSYVSFVTIGKFKQSYDLDPILLRFQRRILPYGSINL